MRSEDRHTDASSLVRLSMLRYKLSHQPTVPNVHPSNKKLREWSHPHPKLCVAARPMTNRAAVLSFI
jgi:hypothetical protein